MTIAFPTEETNATTAPSTAPTNRISELSNPETPTSEISNPEISNSDRSTTSRKLPLSEKRLAANRANAQKSTGPRTQQGKQTVSKNATTHALTATPDPTLFQDPNYSSRLYELTKEFRPQSPSQTYLVEQLALIGHKLDQIPQIESHLLAQTAASNPQFAISNPQSLPSLIAQELLQDKPTPLTRLYDLQRRLQSRFQSIIRQIHQLQKHQSTQRTQTLKQQPTREDQDHDALTEELNRIHEQNKQKELLARQQRQREQDINPNPAQNKPTASQDNPPTTPSKISNPEISNPPAQIKPTDPPVTSPPTPASNPSSNTTQIGDIQ